MRSNPDRLFRTSSPGTAPLRRMLFGGAALAALAACEGPVDADLRGLGNGFSTAEAVQSVAMRPAPDARGVISYPTYQVALAQQGDTMRTMAARLGINAEELARHNGSSPDAALRRDEVVALPNRIGDAPMAGGLMAGSGSIAPTGGGIDVTTLASSAIDRAGNQNAPVQTLPAAAPPPAAASPAPAAPAGSEPLRHQVVRGETVYSISRLYNVAVRSIAEWNGLGADLAIREGQNLLIPVAGAAAPPRPAATTPPGTGSVTPTPPSAAAPLPAEEPSAPLPAATTPPPPDLGTPAPAPAPAAPASVLARPVQGSIIRAFAAGRNDGIDIGAPAGTEVKAAAAGTVAAVTTNTEGIRIVVIRHEGSLLTVYTHVDNLTVAKDATVTRGQTIGRVRAGDPSFLHFQVRRGMESVDPTTLLP